MKKQNLTILLDGDILVYQAASVTEKPVNWGDGLWTLHAEEAEAVAHFEKQLDYITSQTKIDDVKIFLTGKANFRKTLYPEYKANRTDKRKPLLLPFLREYVIEKHGGIICEGIEADDAIGVYSVNPNSVIVSKDKDLLTIAGTHWSPEQGFFVVTHEEADYNFHVQTLTGDTTDNYKGCPSIGPVKAKKILEKAEDPWEAIVAAFEKAGLSEAAALTQARLARILRPNEYNLDKNEVSLWHPKLTSQSVAQSITPTEALSA